VVILFTHENNITGNYLKNRFIQISHYCYNDLKCTEKLQNIGENYTLPGVNAAAAM